MKHLRLFESKPNVYRNISRYQYSHPERNIINQYNKQNLHPNLKFKIGDYVRFVWGTNNKNIYQIVAYHSDLYKWYLSDTLELNGFRQPDQFWTDSDDLVLVPEHEIEAMKYNL